MEQWQVRLFSPCLLMVLSWRFTSVAWGAIRLVTPEAMKKFIIAAAYLSATLASNAPAKDKQHNSSCSGRPCLPRGHNAVPQWERLHLFHRAVSYHCTAVHCSVGSFNGNSKPREPSLKSTIPGSPRRRPKNRKSCSLARNERVAACTCDFCGLVEFSCC